MKKVARTFAYYYALLFSSPKFAKFHYLIFKLALKGLGVLNYYDRKVSGEDYLIKQLLPFWINNKESPIFFDIGANRGDYTLLLAAKFPKSQIISFEPHPISYRVLQDLNINNISAYELALGEKPGEFQLYDLADLDGSTHASLYAGVIEGHQNDPIISHMVKVSTIDEIMGSLGIQFVDFIKIDTEGSELSIIKGAREMLSQKRIGIIQFEFNEMNVFSRTFMRDFIEIMCDYDFFRLLPGGLLPLSNETVLKELFAFQNILAIPKKLN